VSVLVKRLGIDLGTTTVRAHLRRQGLVVEEPDVVAFLRSERAVVALGRSAAELESRTLRPVGDPPAVPAGADGEGVEIVRPIRAPAIDDLLVTAALVAHLVQGTIHRLHPLPPDVVVTLPATTSGVERRALTESAIAAGARRAWLIDGPIAAALGAGLAVAEPQGCAVCDLGGGTTELAVLAASGTVTAETIEVAGSDLDAAIMRDLERRRHLRVDARAAEQLKREAGAALPLPDPLAAEVIGVDADTGAPRRDRISSDEISAALAPTLDRLAGRIRAALDSIPHAVAGSIASTGLTLTGGGANLRALDRHLEERVGRPVHVAPSPQTCAARGSVIAIDGFQVFRDKHLYLR
jgi:rod shape-determining protein MreB